MSPQLEIDPALPLEIELTFPWSKRLNPIRLIRGRKIGVALNNTPILMLEIHTANFTGECDVGNFELSFVSPVRDRIDGNVAIAAEPVVLAQVTIKMPGSLRQPMHLDAGMNRYSLILIPDYCLNL